MRVLLFLGTALLFTLVFADHQEGHHKEGNDDDHDHKHDHDHHDHKHDHDHHDHKDGHHKKGKHHHHNESLPCHKIADYNSKFSFDLYRHVALDHPSENIVLSPFNILTAFAFLSLGAKAQTHSQIIEGLRFNTSEISEQEIHECFHNLLVLLNDVDRELQLSSGNALFISKKHKILETFLDKSKKFYHSEAFSTDFKNTEEARNQINSYVEKNTHGKIAKLLDSVDQDAILYLISYIYFRGQWQNPFEEELTKEGDFHVNKNTTVKVPFMSRTGFYDVAFHNEATLVSIPYKGGAKAYFILPNEGELSKVEQNYSKEAFDKWKTSMRNRLVELNLPKFSVSGTVNLKEALSKMGLENVFSDSADFSAITEDATIKISKAVHKAVLSVDERGTEAAGATALEAIPTLLPPQIAFNRPFLMTLYNEKSNIFTFSARIVNP
ncbi:alpha-1-antitrypsin-like [Bufo bufo]|uniref:alpha-1-antitrypsin-like n=1 Tax=Bufo bufo TaxID=8384 RepID=UPI001ABE6A32|nr:alpha-1-antitrypsin-like [Bufo bufo]